MNWFLTVESCQNKGKNMKKKKIAIIALLRGGIGHYIAQLSPYLSRDYNLIFISYKYGLPGDEVKLDDPAITNNITGKTYFSIAYNNYKETNQSLGEVITILKEEKIDILNIHIGTIARETSYFLIPLALVAKKIGIKILYTFHDVEPFEKNQAGRDVLNLLYSLADGATVGNEAEKEKLIAKYNFPNNKLIMAKHGIYTIFDFHKYNQSSAKKHLGIPENKKVILCFGILRPYKGFDDVISAMPEILKNQPDAFLYINAGVRVFGGPEDLIKKVKELKLEKNVKMVFDFVPSNEIEPIFKAADVIVLPYRQVSQSGILNIAFNFIKPIILSNLFVEADEIKDKMGIVINPGKPNEIACAVDKILNDVELQKKYQKNMSQYINDNIWEETGKNYKKIIESI